MQADHTRTYWSVIQDIEMSDQGFPNGVFYCGLCSTPYRDAKRCRFHLIDRHIGIEITLMKADAARIEVTTLHRCPCCDYQTEVASLYALHKAQHTDTERATALISSGQLAAATAAAEGYTPKRKRGSSAGPSHGRRSSEESTNSDPSTSNKRGLHGGDAMMTLTQLFVPSDESPLE